MGIKISFDEGGLKGFLAQHAEKFIFAVVLALVAFFIYSSATQEGYDARKGPDDLLREASSAREHIRQDFWRQIEPERKVKVANYPAIVAKGRSPIEENRYAPDYPWNKIVIPPEAKRGDPELYAPMDVEAVGGVYTVAMRRTLRDTEDPWLGVKPATEKPKEKPKKKKKKKSRSRYGGYGEEGYGGYGGYGEEGYGEEEYGEEEGYGEEDYMGGYGSEYGTGGEGTPRQLGQFWIKHYLKGTRPPAGAGAVAKGYGLVAVKALVPFEKQWDEYESVLANATGYVPTQDIPKFVFFEAERADVTDNPDAPPESLDWKPVSNTVVGLRAVNLYASMPPEIADRAYLLPGILTMPVPPVVMGGGDELALHSEIPRQQMRQAVTQRPREEEQADVTELTPEGGLEEGLPDVPRRGTSPYGGGYGEEAYGGYGEEAYGGYGEEAYGGYGEEEYSEYGEEGYGGYGEEGYGGYGGGAPRLRPDAQYKLIRFFDFSAEPGKSYRYRVRAVLEDPNRPKDPKAEPSKQILEKSVVERLAKVEQEDLAYTKQTGKPRRTYYRLTEWSEPSNIVTISNPEYFVAGGVTKGRVVTLPDGAEVEQGESSGKLVTVVWDKTRAVEVPAEQDVFLGSYLSFTTDADVLHPLALQIMRLEDYKFETDAFVADIDGGNPLLKDEIEEEGRDAIVNEYTTPGEFVVVDAQGNLIVRNEIADTEDYRRLLFIEDKPPEALPTDYGSGYDESYEEEEGYGGYGAMYEE